MQEFDALYSAVGIERSPIVKKIVSPEHFLENLTNSFDEIEGFTNVVWELTSRLSSGIRDLDGNACRQPEKLSGESETFWRELNEGNYSEPIEEYINALAEKYEKQFDSLEYLMEDSMWDGPWTLFDFMFLGPYRWIKNDFQVFEQYGDVLDLSNADQKLMTALGNFERLNLFALTFKNIVYVSPWPNNHP